MRREKNEAAHYPEIIRHIESQLQSNFRAGGIDDIKIFWKSGELTSKLEELIREHPAECACIETYAKATPPLNLDTGPVIYLVL